MICSRCKQETSHTWTIIRDGKIIKDLCDTCHPEGRFNSWSKTDKFKSRVLAPDGRTVLTGREGYRHLDSLRKKQI